jgi:aspartate dehydrogenase
VSAGTARALRIGLIGLGNIGGLVVECARRLAAPPSIVGALVRNVERTGAPVPLLGTVEALLAAAPDVVIECAGQPALQAHGAAVLASGCDLVPSSIGLFADDGILDRFRAAARTGGGRLGLPSGAVAGIDGLLGARALGLESVRYRFVMSPAAWGHPVEDGERVVVYRGPARTAARNYPRHANVTATIALAGVGFERTQVELVVDRSATGNHHEIEARGFFGELVVSVAGQRIAQSTPSSRLVAGALLTAAIDGCPHLV